MDNKEIAELIKVAKCPNDCDSGVVAHLDAAGDPDISPCQFCFERDAAIHSLQSQEEDRETITQAHMAGQAEAGIDPSYSNALVYAQRVGAVQSQEAEPVGFVSTDDYGHPYGVLPKDCDLIDGASLYATQPPKAQEAEPVEYQRRMRNYMDATGWTEWGKCTKGTYEDTIRVPLLHGWEFEARKLYTQPPKAPTDNGIEELDTLCRRFNNGEINLNKLVCDVWNTAAAPAKAQIPEWISIEDRLPIEEGKVLIAFGEPFFGKRTTEVECGYYDEDSGKWKFWLFDKEVVGYGVTHWMPLPAAPKPPTEGA